jgi:hypothetical protein
VGKKGTRVEPLLEAVPESLARGRRLRSGGTAFHSDGLALSRLDPASAKNVRPRTIEVKCDLAFSSERAPVPRIDDVDHPRQQWLPPASPTPAYEPQPSQPAPGGPERPLWRRALAPIGVALVFLFTKGKALLLLLPKLKVLSTSATMLVSIGAYSLIWGGGSPSGSSSCSSSTSSAT